MSVTWKVGPGVRADIVTYGGRNLNGKRQQAQFFPTGAQRGTIDGSQVSSMVIRALHGTRIVLAASDGSDWQSAAWRCIRMLPGHTMGSAQKTGLPGVRIPDLDLLDEPDAKRTDTGLEASYAYVERVKDGTGWTFGRGGGLKNRIQMVRIEREDATGPAASSEEAVARAMIRALREHHPDAVDAAAEAALDVLANPDSLRAWLDQSPG